jgi:hypothetical protein
MSAAVRIGNASGFYGDRRSAVIEMLTGGELDYLTGDYLAELTMLILGRDRMKDPSLGYAKTFLRQMETGLGTALDKGVRIVVNAGGLNPRGLADALRKLASDLGLEPKIAHVEGDDLITRADEFGFGATLTANAYLGAWGIVEGLRAGADVVVTGRVTDASLVVAPAAAHFGWARTDYDRLAGAVVAGHIIECGTQATGGNYSFFTEIADLHRPGFPIAEVFEDGSSVITKHAGTGGAVTVGTVTAQLLYEITGARYAGPDVTARFDTISLLQESADRVLVSGVRGEAPPSTLKVGLNTVGGLRNEVTFVLTGLDIEAKAALLKSQLADSIPADAEWTLARNDHEDAATEEGASALLRCVVRGSDPKTVGRAFSNEAIELALASYPGFNVTAPPGDAMPHVPASDVQHVAVLPDGTTVAIEAADETLALAPVEEPVVAAAPSGPVRKVALGSIIGARSGDKGGSANIGVWARSDEAFAWLADALTVAKLRELLPETAPLGVERHVLPNLRALNFVIQDILGQGVSSQARFDPQAKALGEWLRSRHIEIPESLLS